MKTVEHFFSAQNEIAEGPFWSSEEQSIYWVDLGKCLHCFNSDTRSHQSFSVDIPLTALARRSSGGWIITAHSGIYFWNQESGELTQAAKLTDEKPEMAFNDSVIDRQGRLLTGTSNSEKWDAPDGSLYRLDIDGTFHKLDTGFATANGLALSPDGKTLYLTDMLHGLIYSYDYDIQTGQVSNRKDLIHIPKDSGTPDGLTVDSEGFIWSAQHGYKVVRYDPDGKMEREIRVPEELVTCLTFGGKQMNEVFITTAWWGFDKEKRRAQPQAGDIFRLETDITGIAEPSFEG